MFCCQASPEMPTQTCTDFPLSSSFIFPPSTPYIYLPTPILHPLSTSMLPVSLAALSCCCLPESTVSYVPEIQLAELPSMAQSRVFLVALFSGFTLFLLLAPPHLACDTMYRAWSCLIYGSIDCFF